MVVIASLFEKRAAGLYHNTAGVPTTEGTARGIAVRFHPNLPVQDHKALWTFDGTFPPKLLMVRYGQAVLMRHYKALPIDPAANRGFGLHTISTHEHNGHTPAESDGYTNAFFFPGQYYDYRWPIQLAGYDSVNTTASDPRAAFPCAPVETLPVNDTEPGMKSCENGSIPIRGDWRETMSTHWFHDHMLDFTAQNVYKGNAAMMNYYSALDRGNEAFDDGVNLRLPSGTALPWGNRDYDVNLLVADKAWDREGQLWFNIFNLDGFLGDQVLVNWLWHPWFEVRARSYRFRILNAATSRYFTIALVQQVQGTAGEIAGPPGSGLSYNRVPFHLIGNDGNDYFRNDTGIASSQYGGAGIDVLIGSHDADVIWGDYASATTAASSASCNVIYGGGGDAWFGPAVWKSTDLGATWGLSETGASGPTGNRYGDAPGHACIAVSGPVEAVITVETGSADREANMWEFARRALELLEDCLRKA